MFDRNRWIKELNHRDSFICSLKKNYKVIDACKYDLPFDKNSFQNSSRYKVKEKLYYPSISKLSGKHYTRLSDSELDIYYNKVEKEFRYLVFLLDSIFSENNIDAIITDGNHQICYYACLYAKEKYRVPVIGIENSFCGGRIYMDIHGGIGNEMKEMKELWEELKPYDIDNKSLSSMNKNKGQVARSFRKRVIRDKDFSHIFSSRKFKNYILVCGQVDNDSVLCRDIHPFKNIDGFFECIVDSTKDIEDLGIIFRIHPWDSIIGNPTFKRVQELCDLNKERLFVIKNKDFYTYNIIPYVDGVITLTSQIGIESCAFYGVPVISCGNAFYDIGEFTLKPEYSKGNALALKESVEKVIGMGAITKNNIKESSQSFSSFLFKEYMIDSRKDEDIKLRIEKAIKFYS